MQDEGKMTDQADDAILSERERLVIAITAEVTLHLASALPTPFPPAPRPVKPKADASELTSRERDVLALLALGYTNKAAGVRLGITGRTVEVHRGHIIEKIGDSAPVVLVDTARRLGLIPAISGNA